MPTRIAMLFALCLTGTVALAQNGFQQTYVMKFATYSAKLTKQHRLVLDSVAAAMKLHPAYYCKVGAACQTENQRQSQATWDRAKNIITYLQKKGVDSAHLFGTTSGYTPDCNSTELVLTDDDSFKEMPPPHPDLRKKKS